MPKYENWAIYPLLSQLPYPSNKASSWIGHSTHRIGGIRVPDFDPNPQHFPQQYQRKNYSKKFEVIALYGESATNFISMNAAKMIILNIIYNWKCYLPDQFEGPFETSLKLRKFDPYHEPYIQVVGNLSKK